MLGDDRHLHIDRRDLVADILGRALGSTRSGTVSISFAGEHAGEAVRITAGGNDEGGTEIVVNLLQPSAFVVSEDETGLFDRFQLKQLFLRESLYGIGSDKEKNMAIEHVDTTETLDDRLIMVLERQRPPRLKSAILRG